MQRAWPGCLATKRWVLGAVALAIGVPAAKGAQAQVPFGPVGGDVTTYYDGIVYRVQLRYTGLSDVHTNVAELRDYLGVLAVDCDAGPAFDATTLAACGAESPYKCTSQACPGARGVEVALVNNLGSQRVLFNLPGGGPQAAWLILTLTVRMHPSATRCGAPTVCALDVGNGDVLGSPQTSGGGENTACQSAARPVLTAVWIGPTPPVQGHNVAGVGLTWQLQAQLSNGSMVPYRQDLADPVAFASNIACAQACGMASLPPSPASRPWVAFSPSCRWHRSACPTRPPATWR
uniref:Pherophorin domain-containing protein n=1 Tax=Auxenochlorella protothecoides TaxID=3075 RepID=A0A1D1ZYK0_AUXPR